MRRQWIRRTGTRDDSLAVVTNHAFAAAEPGPSTTKLIILTYHLLVVCKVLTAEDYPTLADYWERMQQLPRYQECYKDINLLPIGDHIIKPGMSFAGQGTRSPTTFHGQGIKGKK